MPCRPKVFFKTHPAKSRRRGWRRDVIAEIALQSRYSAVKQGDLSKLEEQGVIQVFEFTHELAWNTLKDFLESRGAQNIYGSKDATREAFKAGLLENGETWMDMIRSRNRTTHTYDEATVLEIVDAVTEKYFAAFNALQVKLNKLKEEEQP